MTLESNSMPKTPVGFLDECRRRLFRKLSSFAACEGGFRLIDHRNDFKPPALALFSERQGLLDGLFFAAKPAALNRLLDEGALVRGQLDVQGIVAR